MTWGSWTSLPTVYFLFASFGISLMLTWTWIRIAHRIGFIDIPNTRSSHTRPTPRGGGLAIAVVCLAGAFFLNSERTSELQALGWTSALIALMGWIDDRFHLSAKFKLLIQIGAAVTLVAWVRSPTLGWPISALPAELEFTLLVIYVVWLTNLYNFMDGIDGMVAIQGMVIASSLGLLAERCGAGDLAKMYVILAGAHAGFGVFNSSPALVFMGDVGSAFLGFFFAGLSIISAAPTAHTIALPLELTPILLAVFITDATITVLTRFFTGYNPMRPHREFGFHHLVRSGHSHAKISLLYGAATLLWSVPATFFVYEWPQYTAAIMILVYTPLILLLLRWLRPGQRMVKHPEQTPAETSVFGVDVKKTHDGLTRSQRILRIQLIRARRNLQRSAWLKPQNTNPPPQQGPL